MLIFSRWRCEFTPRTRTTTMATSLQISLCVAVMLLLSSTWVPAASGKSNNVRCRVREMMSACAEPSDILATRKCTHWFQTSLAVLQACICCKHARCSTVRAAIYSTSSISWHDRSWCACIGLLRQENVSFTRTVCVSDYTSSNFSYSGISELTSI